MTKKTHDLAVKTREYTDRDGNTKANWQNIGALMESDDGKPFLMLEAWVNLAAFPRREGSSAVLVSCFELREQDGTQGRSNGAKPPERRGGAAGGKRQPTEELLSDEIPW